MKIIVLLMFIIPTIYNLTIHRKNIINVKKKPIFGFIIALFAVCASMLCYRLDNTILGYTIVVASVLLIYTISFYPGIRKDGFNVFMGGNPFLKHISFKDLNDLSLKKDNNNLDLIIKAYGSTYIQTYDIENKDMILANLKRKKIWIRTHNLGAGLWKGNLKSFYYCHL